MIILMPMSSIDVLPAVVIAARENGKFAINHQMRIFMSVPLFDIQKKMFNLL